MASRTFQDLPSPTDSSEFSDESLNPWSYLKTCEETKDYGLSYITKGYSKGYIPEVPELGEPSTLTRSVKVQGVDINLARSHLLKHVNSYCVRRVVSPFEFYMEQELDSNLISIETREQLMQSFYNKQDLQSNEYEIYVTKWKCYIYQDPLTDVWCRVRVHSFVEKRSSKQVLVYFCDSGRQEVVPCESLRFLIDKFKVLGTPLLRCYLFDVLPTRGGLYWPIDAVLYFKEMVDTKCLNAIVMKMSEKNVVQHSPGMRFDCGVVLMSKSNLVAETINWTMVKRGYAQSIGIMASSPEMLYLPGNVPEFDWIDDSSSGIAGEMDSSVHQVPLEQLRQITNKAMSSSNVDAYYRKSLTVQRPPSPKPAPENYLASSLRDRLAWLKLSFVDGPSTIFVHMQLKYEELQKMNRKLKKEARDLPPPELKKGILVACDIKNNDMERNRWFRGLIKADPTSPSGETLPKVEVILVDYGSTIKVRRENVYKLPHSFRSIPSFAHRVHLQNVRPEPSDAKLALWNRFTKRVFYKYLMSFEVSHPLYYAYRPENQDKIALTDIDQAICFNVKQGKWVAGSVSPTTIESNSSINSMKDDPLLASHFCSYAVNIKYEVLVKPHEFWRFDDLSEFLIDRENSVLTKPVVPKDQIHGIISDGFGTI